jgi:NADPH:quinone reductase-like Zn-dependent oxidoreductase/acyl carrier protein
LLNALAQVWVQGTNVHWGEVYAEAGARRVQLPTYAFQRERFWLESGGFGVGDAGAIGQVSSGHPLLGAAIAMAAGDGLLFTGRLSLRDHPWLGDHVVLGGALLPGTAFLELALYVGQELGVGFVRELTLHAPLVLGEGRMVQLQIAVAEADDGALRALSVYSRVDGAAGDGLGGGEEWVLHAEGVLAPVGWPVGSVVDGEDGAFVAGGVWPPVGAEPVAVDDLYARLAERGLEYGPVFRGLRAAWRRGGEVFAEVALGEGAREQAGSFGVHPALLDGALHAIGVGLGDVEQDEPGTVRLPFSWGEVSLLATGASVLRVRIAPASRDEQSSAVSLSATDEQGLPVLSIGRLALREASMEQIARASASDRQNSLFTVDWVPAPIESSGQRPPADGWVLVGEPDTGLADTLGLPAARVYPDLTALADTLENDNEPAPDTALFLSTPAAEHSHAPSNARAAAQHASGADESPEAVRAGVRGVLGVLQGWLGDERLSECLLVVLTRRAIATRAGEAVLDLAGSAVWGLVRAAQQEHPGRFAIVDVDEEQSSWELLPAVLAQSARAELGTQFAIRGGHALAPRLAPAGSADLLPAPAGIAEWRLQAGGGGTFEDLALAPSPHAGARPEAGQVRLAVRAAGVNFRDVLMALGMYPDEGTMGGEGAGVVLEVGPGVEDLAPGDRVMGLLSDGFGPVAVADRRLLARMPEGWSFARAASVPMAFLTAYYALVDLAELREGERLLVHSAAGGVGIAAVQLARRLGAEVLGTASPGKWGVLESLGLEEGQIASSRELGFRERFLGATDGRGVDVVLNSLAGDFVDASLDLLPGGGRFLEMGKTDVRDPAAVAEEHRDVAYRAFDLMEAGPARIQEMLLEILGRFERGELEPLPVRAWDVRRAPEALRFMSQARHVGKNVLTVPAAPFDSESTVLITGGTGGLGAVLAKHLAVGHGVRHLLLASRGGLRAPGAEELAAELTGMGVEVRIVACDVSDRAQLRALLDEVPAEHALSAVVHAAGVLDDGVIESLSGERLERVLAPKVDGAWHLHELTAGMDLRAFVLFSSASATLGSPGQASYAAANAFLDGLAARRRAQGLPGVSMAWGQWSQDTGMAGQLADVDRARLERAGMLALSTEQGLQLFDAGGELEQALLVAARLDTAALRAQARAGELPALLADLRALSVVRRSSARAGMASERTLAQRLAGVPEAERGRVVLELVRAQVAAVLGHVSPAAVESRRTFKELGFDSLAAVELRNRLATVAGLRLPATLIFDYPTLTALADRILGEAANGNGGTGARPLDVELDGLERVLSSASVGDGERAGVTARLRALLSRWEDPDGALDASSVDDDIDVSSDEAMFDLIDRELEAS